MPNDFMWIGLLAEGDTAFVFGSSSKLFFGQHQVMLGTRQMVRLVYR